LKKQLLAAFLVISMCAALFAGCGGTAPAPAEPAPAPAAPAAPAPAAPAAPDPAPAPEPAPAEPAAPAEKPVINLWAFTDEVPNVINQYLTENPDFGYTVNTTIIATTDGAYQPALDQALAAGGADAPDIFTSEAAFVLKYSQGDASGYSMTYADLLGIDVPAALTAADIASYASQIGTRPSDNAVVALPFQSTGGAYIYRRSIAQDVWGTDDPAVIGDKVGPGWEKYLAAAAELAAKGYSIVSDHVGDIWHPLENSSDTGWVVDGKLNIDPDREYLLDIAKTLKDNGYTNESSGWADTWFADMQDTGAKKVFGFFGPAWLINYTIAPNSGGTAPGEGTYGDWAVCASPYGFAWGGTWLHANTDTTEKEGVAELINWITLDTSDTGMQYKWANGTMFGPGGTKDTVVSGVVMAKSNGAVDFLGGQNMFDIFVPANAMARGDNMTQYDETINNIWQPIVRQYADGLLTREEAIASFKQTVTDTLGIPAE
jgi:hypothetical protein